MHGAHRVILCFRVLWAGLRVENQGSWGLGLPDYISYVRGQVTVTKH